MQIPHTVETTDKNSLFLFVQALHLVFWSWTLHSWTILISLVQNIVSCIPTSVYYSSSCYTVMFIVVIIIIIITTTMGRLNVQGDLNKKVVSSRDLDCGKWIHLVARIRGFFLKRYAHINLRFTYLLTYLLICTCSKRLTFGTIKTCQCQSLCIYTFWMCFTRYLVFFLFTQNFIYHEIC